MKKIDPKELQSRKRVAIYLCVDLKDFYHIVFITEQKSRFLISHADEIFLLEQKVCEKEQHNNKYKEICIKNGLCSKAKQYLVESGWRVYNDFM